MDTEELVSKRDEVIRLRQAGKSLREIKAITGIASNRFLADALRGIPPSAWTRRPNAKDDLRARARELRASGLAYNEIVRQLGVSKGSVSLWVRDMPRLSEVEVLARQSEGSASYWRQERPRRQVARQAAVAEAASQIGALTDRELLIAGAVAYWCEGAKSKPHRRSEQVTFVNSDPGLIRLFLRFLALIGIRSDRLGCRLHIHDDANESDALEFWRGVTGLGSEQFRPSVFKPSRPDTIRKNTSVSYHGCLQIRVHRGQELYWRLDAWATAALSGCDPARAAGAGARRPDVRVSASVRPALRDHAVALRLAGKSRREIQQILEIRSNETLNEALRGVPPVSWTKQVSYEHYRRRQADGVNRYWKAERGRRQSIRNELARRCAEEVGTLSRREILIAGAVAYWCEGAKSKVYRMRQLVVFMNSDPALIRFFLDFLEAAGVASNQIVCRLHIHESGDIGAAEEFWQRITDVPVSQYRRPTLKRHVPKTVWPREQSDYHGCLAVSVLGSRDLYLRIDGWAHAVMTEAVSSGATETG
jgi:hypothetical protein